MAIINIVEYDGGSVEVWADVPGADMEGIIVGVGESRQDAIADAVRTLEALTEQLQQQNALSGGAMNEKPKVEAGATDARWQPISSAPKDTTEILIWDAEGRTVQKAFRMDTSYYLSHNAVRLQPPTHWMPLPAPPGAGEPDPSQPADARWQPRAHCEYCGQSIAIERGKAATHYDSYPLRLCEGGNRKPVDGVVKVGPR